MENKQWNFSLKSVHTVGGDRLTAHYPCTTRMVQHTATHKSITNSVHSWRPRLLLQGLQNTTIVPPWQFRLAHLFNLLMLYSNVINLFSNTIVTHAHFIEHHQLPCYLDKCRCIGRLKQKQQQVSETNRANYYVSLAYCCQVQADHWILTPHNTLYWQKNNEIHIQIPYTHLLSVQEKNLKAFTPLKSQMIWHTRGTERRSRQSLVQVQLVAH